MVQVLSEFLKFLYYSSYQYQSALMLLMQKVQQTIVLVLFASVWAQEYANITKDEATILLASDLSDEARATLLSAIEGAPTQGDTGTSYLLVPDNATVVIIDGEDIISDSSCLDTPPDNQFSCAEQMKFGQCDAEFMMDGNYCAKTCNRCEMGGSLEMSTGEESCTPLSVLLSQREDTYSFRDALNIVGLESLLSDSNKVATILIPNDLAFFAALEQLGQDSEQLTRFTKVKQMIEGLIIPNMAVRTESLVDGQPLIPLSGQGFWYVEHEGGSVIIQNGILGPATVVEPNIVACEIIAHIIDKLLLF
eukprot:TRINITY_DN23362_c0_g2_i10.p1 TRINITY_DN23362_c0_g2~~TRINITY_DN23362_c0_g2_i10.p1  ORF type:complete len:307 (+),score=17.60 TRINITY_DN23362_c0_g2_i10:1180-2100(+)